MHRLISAIIAPSLGIAELGDAAVMDDVAGLQGRIAFTTDSYVVSPLFFPGGNIGELAVNGTVNDLAMVGARPLWLSSGMIIEEGFPTDSLRTILSSMAAAACSAGIRIIAGDTKVVDKGKGDGIFINTAGIGLVPAGVELGPTRILPGDVVLVSGHIGSHGVAVMAERNGLSFDPPVVSDTAALNGLVADLLAAVPGAVKMMRDPTRGGVATTLKEIAGESGKCVELAEGALPVLGGVRGACELLGLDPLYVANEGIFLAIVDNAAADTALDVLKRNALGRNAARIGMVREADQRSAGMVLLKTLIGGTRIIDMLAGEQLPRIC